MKKNFIICIAVFGLLGVFGNAYNNMLSAQPHTKKALTKTQVVQKPINAMSLSIVANPSKYLNAISTGEPVQA